MGAITSRQNAAVEETDISSNHAYKYPPKSGNYFGCHFIMGGEKFETPQPEAYLFGENSDLNFLGSRPAPFPYPPPQANELTKTLKSLVNIRKESVRFVKAIDSATKLHGNGTGSKGSSFNIEFTFDADAKCAITVYYFCMEEIGPNGLLYIPRDTSLTSETYHYERGANQLFSQTSHIFNPALFPEEDLAYNPDKDVFPIVIHCVVEEGMETSRQSHTTVCVIDRHPDGSYALRALKQKIFIDGLCYLLQEIYGIENKSINRTLNEDDTEDNGSECVICMSETRDTLILPCRHLCLCNSCADSLRYQANNCPICRAPFRALLQIRAVQKNANGTANIIPPSPQDCGNENIPEGYVAVSLIEALNGPLGPPPTRNVITNEGDFVDGGGDGTDNMISRNNDKNGKQSPKELPKNIKEKINQNTPEFRMSVLLKEDGGVTKELLTKHSPLMNRAPASRDKNPREKGSLWKQQQRSGRDRVNFVNEKNPLSNTTTPATATTPAEEPNSHENDEDSEAEKLSPLLNPKMVLSPTKEILASSALHMDGVDESIDDTDTDDEDIAATTIEGGDQTNKTTDNNNKKGGQSTKLNRPTHMDSEIPNPKNLAVAEDSDYYTPEDSQTNILSPKINNKFKKSDVDDNNDDDVKIKDNDRNDDVNDDGDCNSEQNSQTKSKNHLSSPLAAIKDNTTSLPDSPISGNSTSTRSSGDSYSSSSSTRQLLAPTSSNTTSIVHDPHTIIYRSDQIDHENIVNV